MTEMRAPFIWNEIEMWVLGEIMETIMLIDDSDEAADFFEAYAAVCKGGEETATYNLRYVVQIVATDDEGEGGEEEAKRIAEMFELDYPEPSEVIAPIHTFGGTSMGIPENEEKAA